MAIILPYRRFARPGGPLRVNWAHPFTKDLRVIWEARNANASFGEASITGALNSLSLQFSDSMVVSAVANAGVQFGTAQPLRLTYQFTFVIVAAPRAEAKRKTAITQRVNATLFEQVGITFNQDANWNISTGSVNIFAYGGTSANYSINITPFMDGNVHCYGFARIGTTAVVAIDGGLINIATNAPALTMNYVSSAQKFVIGNAADYTGTDYVFDDPLYLVLAWDRYLPAHELAEITANPWRIFQQRTDPIIFPVSSAAYPTLSDLKAVNITGSSVQATVDYVF